jgi:Ca-activated chloride channel family protein
MIEWMWPWIFWALPLPLLIRFGIPRDSSSETALTVPNMRDFSNVVATSSGESSHQLWKIALLSLAWILLVTAAARPQLTGDPISLPASGRDLMLAVDISGSMGTEDMQVQGDLVDRLSVVKAVIAKFVEARNGDRVGLVLFGTNAYLQAPLTFDLKSVNRLLIEAPVGIAGGKTAIGDAIGLAVKRLRKRPNEEKVLILLTDGANNVGEVGPKVAAELATRDGIKIYTIGVGADEMRQRGIFGALSGRITNPSADLDEDTLKKIARVTGGKYFRARDPQTLIQIYAIIDELEPVEQEAEIYRPVQALFFWPLGLCLTLLCLMFSVELWSNRKSANA